jgi:transcriptional regulator with XRE-family HTH domain
MSDFPNTLRSLRNEKNYRQEDIAEVLGLSKQVISNYENGLREPSFDILIKLSEFFNVSTDYLLGRTIFKNSSEEKALAFDSDSSNEASEFSIKIYRKLRACLEKAQYFYKEKMNRYDDEGCGELFFCIYEKLNNDIELFDRILDILLNYRDYSDRDEAIRTFLLRNNNSKLDSRIVAEILRIDHEI